MLRRRILHHIRFIAVLCIGLILGTVVGGVYYLNQSGLNDQWRDRIAQELENLGVVADFESLRFQPTKGLVATGVRVYADDSRETIVARLEHLVIDVDKTKLIRGIVRVNNVSLKKADISLPIDPDDPNGPRVTMNDLSGDMFLPDKRTIEASGITGMVAGIHLSMNARIWSEHLGAPKQPKPVKDVRLARVKLIARIIQEIHEWHWPEGKPPELELYLEGNVDNPDSARLDFILKASELERSGVVLKDIEIRGDYKNRVVTLERMSLSDGSGKLEAQADFRPKQLRGRFKADSTLHIQMLARQLFGVVIMNQLTFSTPPSISCTGEISFDEDFTPDVLVTGHANIDYFSCLGSRFKHLKTDFSTQGSDAFLTGLHVTHDQGKLKGRILLKNEIIRYQAESTLPASAYAPFLTNSGIEKALSRAEFTDSSKIHITAQGTMSRNDLTQWEAEGHANLQNFTFKDSPLHSLEGDYSLNRLRSHFTDVRANFDYKDYILRRKHGGPSSAKLRASSITVDVAKNLISIKNISGTAWPAPVVRLFDPDLADHVECYRFHRPPSLLASGTFDLRDNGSQSDFTINLSSPGSMNYEFLGEPLTLRRLKARVKIRDDRVDVNQLSFYTLQGACSGNVRVYTSNPASSRYAGDMQFRRLHLKDIGKLYEFDNANRGLLTGRIDFNGEGDNMRKFNGKGSLALEKGNLFSVPMLGPISPLVGIVLGKRNPTEETAKDASLSYVIQNGIVYSNDFLATTRSLKFTGEGKVDLKEKEIDMLMRMNARGLFGFLALPVRPFMGLFQFKGTGPVMNPKWRTSMFTTPTRGKKDPIFRKPPKARVIKE